MRVERKVTYKRLDEKTAASIRERYSQGGISQGKLAREFGISQVKVWNVLKKSTEAKAS